MRYLLLLTLFVSAAFAQVPGTPQTQPAATGPRSIWRCNMPGGTYEVLVGAIMSVSSHEYIVDGAARVTEVNVDTNSQLVVRFYYIEPVAQSGPAGIGAATIGKVQNLMTEAAERTGTDAWKKVVKSYPMTTHARTVEYRLATKESLTKIFNSASKVLHTGRPEDVTISE